MAIFFRKQNSQSDEALVEAFRKSGDKRFVGELFTRHTRFVLGICMKYLKNVSESEDASMQIFESLFDKLTQHEVTNFRGWLATVARNYCLMQIRSRKSFEDKLDEFNPQIHSSLMENEHFLHLTDENSTEEMLQALEKGIDLLKPEQRICVELFYLKNKSYQEVAYETGFNLNQVKSAIQNGKRNLKLFLTKKE